MEHLKEGRRQKAEGRKWLLALLLGLLLSLAAQAGDLTRSITFSDGQRLTAANLHTLVDGASVNVTFLTGKSLLSTVDSSDAVLVYDTSTGTFKRMTLATLIMGNTDLITTQVEATEPAANDYFLIYDASGGTLAKLSYTNLLTGNSNLIGNLPAITNITAPANVWVQHGGTNVHLAVSNLWLAFQFRAPFTNLLAHTSPTNADALLIWDSVAGTNKQTTLAGLATNLPLVATAQAGDWITHWNQTNGLSRMTLSTLSNTIFPTTIARRYAGTNALPAAGGAASFTHGLPGRPIAWNFSLICTNNDAGTGYVAGDQIAGPWFSSDQEALFITYFTDTTLVTRFNSLATFRMNHKSTGLESAVSARDNFLLRLDAVYFP